jgi:hypothetical protein
MLPVSRILLHQPAFLPAGLLICARRTSVHAFVVPHLPFVVRDLPLVALDNPFVVPDTPVCRCEIEGL